MELAALFAFYKRVPAIIDPDISINKIIFFAPETAAAYQGLPLVSYISQT